MLADRYPAPMAETIWSKESRIVRFRTVTDAYALSAFKAETGSNSEMAAILARIPNPTPEEWEAEEKKHGHEIVGFLASYLALLPSSVHPYIHYGLTSSDLTEYDLHEATKMHLSRLQRMVENLVEELLRKSNEAGRSSYRAGRTHGQTAELTTLEHQFEVHRTTLDQLHTELWSEKSKAVVTKSAGPTGFSPIWKNPPVLHGVMYVPSTQVVPRDHLVKWAMLYQRLALALENLALFIRCGARSEIGEFREGAERIGSSAMPGKRNPIDSEKVCGLARVARGHLLTIMESYSLWEDRDLSNSSAERIAVPGLAAVVEHMTETMTKVVRDLEVDWSRISKNAQDPRTRMNTEQSKAQREHRVGPIAASQIVAQRQEAK